MVERLTLLQMVLNYMKEVCLTFISAVANTMMHDENRWTDHTHQVCFILASLINAPSNSIKLYFGTDCSFYIADVVANLKNKIPKAAAVKILATLAGRYHATAV